MDETIVHAVLIFYAASGLFFAGVFAGVNGAAQEYQKRSGVYTDDADSLGLAIFCTILAGVFWPFTLTAILCRGWL